MCVDDILSHCSSSENGQIASDIKEIYTLNKEIIVDNNNFIIVNNYDGIINNDNIDPIDIQSK